MGLTPGCAVCHDHKFDPITQKEFYQLFAFFNAAADAAMDGNALAPPPIIKLPTAEQERKSSSWPRQLAASAAEHRGRPGQGRIPRAGRRPRP